MYQFFVEPSQIDIPGKRVIITGEDVNHIKNVLRMKPGEEINISNGTDGKEYRCAVAELFEDSVVCELRFIKEEGNELPVRVTLYQGLPKGDKMELIIQKCVELGISRIVPVSMKRCVMKLEDKKAGSKIARWQAIAEAAAKQSKRSVIPEIAMPLTYGLALQEASATQVRLVPYEMAGEMEDARVASHMDRTREILHNIPDGAEVSIFIGPEGGFDDSEIEKAIENGFTPITLGKRILRTETAGFTALSWIVYEKEK